MFTLINNNKIKCKGQCSKFKEVKSLEDCNLSVEFTQKLLNELFAQLADKRFGRKLNMNLVNVPGVRQLAVLFVGVFMVVV